MRTVHDSVQDLREECGAQAAGSAQPRNGMVAESKALLNIMPEGVNESALSSAVGPLSVYPTAARP